MVHRTPALFLSGAINHGRCLVQTKSLMLTCALVIAASLGLGGGTRGGLLSDAILQLIGLPLLILALWPPQNPLNHPLNQSGGLRSHPASPVWSGAMIWPLAIMLAALLIPLLQLVPLPAAVWRFLPQSETVAAALNGSGARLSALSVAPHMTWLAVLSLIPPCAVFFATVRLPLADRRRLTVIILVIGVLSVFVGLIQLAQGHASKLRFYDITNAKEAVGFFANRNHFSALLYCLTLFAAAWALEYARKMGALPFDRRFDSAVFLPSVAVFTVLVVLLAAQGMARSRAGLGLTIIAVLGVYALALPERARVAAGGSIRSMTLVLGVVLALVAQFALYGILERFGSDPLADPRVVFARNTMTAARSFMPFGSGVGTFVPVYGMFETPADALAGAYVNRAHNDFLEIWLESGVFGPALIALFVLWLLVRAVAVWRPAPLEGEKPRETPSRRSGHLIDHSLARAATLVIALLIAHSATDYPLRTGALMVVFAFATALLVPPPLLGLASDPPAAAAALTTATAEAVKPHRARTRRMPPAPPVPLVNPVLSQASWPDAWRQPNEVLPHARSWPTAPQITTAKPADAALAPDQAADAAPKPPRR